MNPLSSINTPSFFEALNSGRASHFNFYKFSGIKYCTGRGASRTSKKQNKRKEKIKLKLSYYRNQKSSSTLKPFLERAGMLFLHSVADQSDLLKIYGFQD
jgi:hypothetical protein